MAAAIPIRVRRDGAGLRPVDTLRDLPAIVKLVEIGFGDELDPVGWKMVERMRRAARRNFWAQLISLQTLELSGFVWAEESAVVGNLSLRPAAASHRTGWLIGNVVVAPEYRGHGIGRALMETALESAQAQGARWVGLEVRADNAVARTLYEDLGFKAVGETLHLIRPKGLPWPAEPRPRERWRSQRATDPLLWAKLAEQVYPRAQRDILEIRPGVYAYGGWERTLTLWLEGQREQAWLRETELPRLAACVQTDRRSHFHVWELLMHPFAGEAGARELVAQALQAVRSSQPWPVVTIVAAQPALLEALSTLNFKVHRTLLQMQLTL